MTEDRPLAMIAPKCYDRETGEIYDVQMVLFETGNSGEIDHSGNSNEPINHDHFVIIPPTGLTDKNGNMIYEYHKIREPWNGHEYTVIWQKQKARFMLYDEVLDLILTNTPFQQSSTEKWEIIGFDIHKIKEWNNV